ncbi:MAG: cysteine--tRNA ligase [Thermoplasmata archaeon]|nr:cysteine--tRNA ligase [Thermoplasmata archaeon]
MRRVQLYDTLSRETRLLMPITPPKVGLFVCGLTPYADAHVGHAKVAVVFDVVARALTRWGYRVFYVQNVTNLDDRLIERGGATSTDPMKLADQHFAAWRSAMDELNVRTVNYYPHATDYLPEIIVQVQQLVDRGFAYAARGSVYYDVARFPKYGALSGQKVEALQPGARVAVEAAKRSPEDFVLWKAAQPGEPAWESPWGPGRPGWHIEDTAITVRLFGPRYDVHGGGMDLKFPHHEAEIAQAEAATGESPLVNYWMHVGLVTMKGEKMSKSLGNVYGLDEALRTHGAEVLRFYYLNAHYRNPLDFAPGKSLEEAGEAYERLAAPARKLAGALRGSSSGAGSRELPAELAEDAVVAVRELDELLADDFNTREAIARLFVWSKRVGEWLPELAHLSPSALESLAAPYRWAGAMLGLFGPTGAPDARDEALAALAAAAIEARAAARTRGDFAEADRIRGALARAGIRLEDHGSTTSWQLGADDDAG